MPPATTSRKLPDVAIRRQLGRPTVFVDDAPVALAGYSNFGLPRLKYTMDFFLGVETQAVYTIMPPRVPGDQCTGGFWSGDTIAAVPAAGDDLWDLDAQAEQILRQRPDAYLVVRFIIRPPESWTALHPAELFVTEEGGTDHTPSLASEAYWQGAAAFSATIVAYCESRPWADRVIAYSNGHHTEGVNEPLIHGWLFDHSAPMRARWQTFLRTKYGAVEELRAAYGDPALTFENVPVPKDKLRGPVPEVTQRLYWQAGPDNQPLRDYLELIRDLFHQRFRQLGMAMDGAKQRKIIFLHDALKQMMLGWNIKGLFGYSGFGADVSWNPYFTELMAGSGNMGVAALDDAPGYDGLDTPYDYQTRGTGGVFEPEGVADSLVLRGKVLYCQMDARFHATYGIGAARDHQEAAVQTWRNRATAITRGFYSYLNWGFEMEDWIYEEPFKSTYRRQIEVVRESLSWPHETMPGIAMLLDDASVLETNGSGNYLNEAIRWEWHMHLPRCGIPFRTYLFEDLALDNFPEHRVFYFPNLFRADEWRMALLRGKVFRNGHVVVWGPGSGISDGTRIGTASAEALTGFTFSMLPANAPRRVLISNFTHPITAGLDAATCYGSAAPFGPLLLPTNGTELGISLSKGGFNAAGLSVLSFGKGAGSGERGPGDYDAVFSTAVQLPAALWRNLGRYAGAHVYCEEGDIVLADSSVVALHSLKPGVKTIKLPGTYDVRDVVTGQPFAEKTDILTFELSGPDTRVFLLER
ncbi:MAG: hypothetical protein ACYC7E_06905 [Armatimonadota bacterium]